MWLNSPSVSVYSFAHKRHSAKVALGCQLFALGVVDEPSLSLHSEVCRVFEEMFDEHGDTLAWQYAGSQLVHSIKHYKKTSAFQVSLPLRKTHGLFRNGVAT